MEEWLSSARTLVETLREAANNTSPPAEIVLISWRNENFIAVIQVVFPQFDKEIVLLNKAMTPMPQGLFSEVRKLFPQIPVLDCLQILDLGLCSYHFLRRQGDSIVEMTYEQTMYTKDHLPQIQDERGIGSGFIRDYPYPASG